MPQQNTFRIQRTAVVDDSDSSGGGSSGRVGATEGHGGGDSQLERLEEGLERTLKRSETGLSHGIGDKHSANSVGGSDTAPRELLICGFLHRAGRRGREGQISRQQQQPLVHGHTCSLVHIAGWTFIFFVGAYISSTIKLNAKMIVWFPNALLIGSVFQLHKPIDIIGVSITSALSMFYALAYKVVKPELAVLVTLFYLMEAGSTVLLLWKFLKTRHPLFNTPRQICIFAATTLVTAFLFGMMRCAIIWKVQPEKGTGFRLMQDDFPCNWLGISMMVPLAASMSLTNTHAWIWRTARRPPAPSPSSASMPGGVPHRTTLKLWLWAGVIIFSIGHPFLFDVAFRDVGVTIECSIMSSFPIMLFAGTLLGIPGLASATFCSCASLAIVLNGEQHIALQNVVLPPSPPGPPPPGFPGGPPPPPMFTAVSRIRLWRTIFCLAALFVSAVVAETSRVLRSVESLVSQQTAVIQSALDDAARARDAERDANRHKAGFLAFLCHELRNPLHAILNMSTFLLEELSCQPSGETQDMDRSAQAIGLASEYMLSLINDTLDMGRFEAGEVHLHRVPVNFRQLLDDTIVWARELVKDQDVGVEATVEANVPTSVVVDPVRSQQVVNNLIINAYKFSPPQSKIKVHVSAKLTKSSGHTHTIHVAVTDMGPSLTPAQVQLLFQPYAIQTSACREYGGSGLGLAITNKISKLMGGWIECEPGNGGQGSVFTFVLPVAQVANASTHNKRDDSRGRDEAGELGVKQVAPPMLLDGQKCLERNVAAARFDELTKQLTERPLVARALEMSVGVGARLEHKKDTSLPSVDELSAGKNGSTVAMGPVDAQYQQVHMQPSSSASSANSNAGLGLVPVAPRPSSGFYGSDDGDMGFFQGGPTSPGARPRMPRRRTGDSMMSTAAAAAVATVGLQPGSRGSPRPSFDSFPDGLAREIRARLIEDDGSNDQVHQSGGGPQNYNTQSPSNVRHVRSIPRPALEVAPFTTVPRAPSPLQASLTQSPSVAPAALKQHAQNEKEVDARPVVIPATSSAEELHDRGNAILVVDDSGINRRILCRHLSRMTDLPIHQAADGQEAIKAYGAHNAPSYSIIFMDLMMPNVDGHEATRRIRDMGCTAPIVATTASVVPGEEVQAMVHLRESGMSQALPKPFTKEQIEGVLRTYQVQMIEAGQSPPKPPTFTRSAPVPVMAAGETTGLSPKGMPRHNNSSPEGLENIKPANDGMAPQPHRGRSQHQHQHLSSSPQGMPSYPSPTSRRPSLRDNALVQSSMQPLDNILQAPVPTPPQSQPQWLPPSLRLQSHPQPQPQPQKVSPHQLNHVRPRLPSPSDTLRQQATYMPAFSSQYYPPASVLSVPSAASLHRIRKSASADGSWNRGSFEPIKRPFVPQTQALEGEMHSTLYDIEDQSAAEAFKLSVPMLGRPALLPQASALLGCKSNSYVLSDAAEGNQPSPSDSPPAPRSRVILNSLPTRTIPPGRLIKTHSDPPSAIGTRPSTPLVLVVDDSNVSRGILGRVLDSIGLFETHDAINGIEALQRCFWSTYNIIFMDLEMPRMGGQEAAARIRSTGYAGPIIVITAHPLDSLPHGLAQVGITECLAKPITREVICAVLKRYHLLRGS